MIEKLLQDPLLKEWCNSIVKWNLTSFGRAKGCGLDFKDSSVTFKVYVELLDFPHEEILEDFILPSSLIKTIKNLEQYWNNKKTSGLCFGYKLSSEGEHRKYFHIKLNSFFPAIKPPPKELLFLRMLGIDYNSLEKGISYEMYLNNNFFQKDYVYVTNLLDMKKVLMYKNMGKDLILTEIEELEIYATSNKHKINIVNKNNNFQIEQKNIEQDIPSCYYSKIKQAEELFDSSLVYTGQTSDKTYSSYFSLTNKTSNFLGI